MNHFEFTKGDDFQGVEGDDNGGSIDTYGIGVTSTLSGKFWGNRIEINIYGPSDDDPYKDHVNGCILRDYVFSALINLQQNQNTVKASAKRLTAALKTTTNKARWYMFGIAVNVAIAAIQVVWSVL